ncbi:hypothetical protein G7046_g7675 [Stylonectria norvegica]|nr:hypothetical protein G7046_g7675 [Stylonectria norvegica]
MSGTVSAVVFSGAPYHIIAYGTLLGTSFFHTFINGIVMFKTIDRPAFSAVQQKLFPIYFGLQTILPVVMALTFPGNALIGLPSGVSGLISDFARWHSLLPIATMFVTGLLNWTILLSATTNTMKARRGQAKREGKEWYSEGPHSDEMKALNKRFGILHGASSLLNVGTYLAAIAYGFTLGGRVLSVADLA